jgi:hypothetical protein
MYNKCYYRFKHIKGHFQKVYNFNINENMFLLLKLIFKEITPTRRVIHRDTTSINSLLHFASKYNFLPALLNM